MPTIIKCNRQFGQNFMIERKMKTMAMLIDLEPVLEVAKMTGFGTPADLIQFLKMQPIVEPKQEWISVKDRLPDSNYGSVLIYTKDGGVAEGQYYDTIKAWLQFRWSVEDAEVTHWMPLPEPPTKKGK